ncbi:MAG: cell division protein FtsL [Megasphaera sp.]|jgi:cell division protein FtsL|nr:cell division protein FtsL [Megasphaera sp.]MCH4187569.1 cell division protein FtsL [Megasphaera sp.]MCH4217886.1 cell division protein FtsL [Megasphaera sp.]
MLARKVGYVHYEGTRTFPAGQIKTADRHFTHRLVQTLTIVGLIGFFLLIFVALSAAKTNYTYTLMQEKHQVQDLQRDNDNLRIDISKLEAPERVYTTATKDLGMVAPTRILYGSSQERSGTSPNGR